MERTHSRRTRVAGFLPIWLICTVFCTFLSLEFAANNALHDYRLHLKPLTDNQLSLDAFTLAGLDFSQVDAVIITLKDKRSVAASLIADDDETDFAFARVSNFPPLASGYYHFRHGLVQWREPLQAETDSPARFIVLFSPNLLPKPARKLSIVIQPDQRYMNLRSLPTVLSRFSLRYTDGRVRTLNLSPLPPWPLTVAAGFLLAMVLHVLVKRTVAKSSRLSPYQGRFPVTRLLGSLWLTVFILYANTRQLTATNTTKALLILVALFLLVWSVFGCYPIPHFFRSPRRRSLKAVLYPIILLLIFTLLSVLSLLLLWRLTRNVDTHIEAKYDFSTFADDRARPVVMCLGGSSTKGSPFPDAWPYSYPKLLKKRLEKSFPAAVVLNGGIDGERLADCLPALPELMNKFHPQVVTFNFTWNDFVYQQPDQAFIENYSRQLASADRIVSESGGHALFILEPAFPELYPNSPGAETMITLGRSIYRKLNLSIVDPYPQFALERNGFLFVDKAVHLSRYGTDLLAEILAEHIEPLLIPPAPNE